MCKCFVIIIYSLNSLNIRDSNTFVHCSWSCILIQPSTFKHLVVHNIWLVSSYILCFDKRFLGYMFRELMHYCITMIASSGVYSLALQHTATSSFVTFFFRVGNVFHWVCLGSSSRRMLLPRRILSLLSSFLSLFEAPPSCIALIGVGENIKDCLSSTLSGAKRPSITKTFGPDEFKIILALPTVQIFERHDFRTLLVFLLIKMRTAQDRDWLQHLRTLNRVFCISTMSVVLGLGPFITALLCRHFSSFPKYFHRFRFD